MNDEMRELQARLERATARGNVAPDALDAETAALREGWLALGQVLQSAETGLAASFEKRCRERAGTGSLSGVVSPTLPPTGAEPVPISSRRRAGLLPLPIAAAAVLLVAVTIAWQLPSLRSPDGGEATPGTVAKTDERPTPQPQDTLVPAPREKSPTAPSPAVELAWDDALDGEIASVGQAVLRVEQEWNALADASAAVQYQVQQLSQEFGDK